MYAKHESRVAKVAHLTGKIRKCERQIETLNDAIAQSRIDIEKAEASAGAMAEVLKDYEEAEARVLELNKQMYDFSVAFMSAPDYDPEKSYMADPAYQKLEEEKKNLQSGLTAFEGRINKIFYGKG